MKPETLTGLGEKMFKNSVEMALTTGYAVTAETSRSMLVNPSSIPLLHALPSFVKPEEQIHGLLNPDNPIYAILQNSGDFYDGLFYTYFAYKLLNFADTLQATITHKHVPEKVQQAAVMFLGIAAVTLVETGVVPLGTPDIKDIPAGALGAWLAVYMPTYIGDAIGSHKPAPRKLDKNQPEEISISPQI